MKAKTRRCGPQPPICSLFPLLLITVTLSHLHLTPHIIHSGDKPSRRSFLQLFGTRPLIIIALSVTIKLVEPAGDIVAESDGLESQSVLQREKEKDGEFPDLTVTV